MGGRGEGRKDSKMTLKGQVWEIELKVGSFAEKERQEGSKSFKKLAF